jgi:hypothetical protein
MGATHGIGIGRDAAFVAAVVIIFSAVFGAGAEISPGAELNTLNPGARWQYEITPVDGSAPYPRTLVVERVESTDTGLRYTLFQSDKKSEGDINIVNDGGQFFLESLDADFIFGMGMRVRFVPRLPLVMFPVEPGFHQEADTVAKTIFRRRRLHVASEVMRRETVALPMGNVECLLVHVSRTFEGRPPSEIYVWYAPSVGMVKFMSPKDSGILQSYDLATAGEAPQSPSASGSD